MGVDVRVGKINMGRTSPVADASPLINVGVTLEKVFSEYFRVYLRPAYEYKRYALDLPTTTIDHRNSAFFLTLGVSINYPDLPRSPIKNDKTQMRHYVSDRQGNKKNFADSPSGASKTPRSASYIRIFIRQSVSARPNGATSSKRNLRLVNV